MKTLMKQAVMSALAHRLGDDRLAAAGLYSVIFFTLVLALAAASASGESPLPAATHESEARMLQGEVGGGEDPQSSVPPASTSKGSYEAYFHYLGDYPYEENGFTAQWSRECQGLAHDDNYWFITLNCIETDDDCCVELPSIWKIHVGEDLQSIGEDWDGSGDVSRRTYHDWPQLSGYDHFGDPDYYNYQGRGYLLVGVAGSGPDALAILNAGDLTYVAHAALEDPTSDAWVAVDRSSSEGFVYFGSTRGGVINIDKYFLDWDRLYTAQQCSLEFLEAHYLTKEDGSYYHPPQFLQGGEFTPTGELLYMVTGMSDPDHDEGDPLPEEEGIHVFDTADWTRIQHSTLCGGCFNFCYYPYGIDSEEPEGLTIWDLDGRGVPGITGQLHVILLDNDAYDCDDIYLKHYHGIPDIYVNWAYAGVYEYGTPEMPFRTVTAALNVAWNGSILHVRSGCYDETPVFTRRMEVLPEGGTVVIGACP